MPAHNEWLLDAVAARTGAAFCGATEHRFRFRVGPLNRSSRTYKAASPPTGAAESQGPL